MKIILIIALLLSGCLETKYINICREICVNSSAGFSVEVKLDTMKCECLGDIEKVYETNSNNR